MWEEPHYQEIAALEKSIFEQKEKLYELRRKSPRLLMKDYSFLSRDNRAITLSELFGDKPELILVHNMGKSCPYCTLWADGFNGIHQHLSNRAAFVVSTPDSPEVMDNFAKSRGWKFDLVSTSGTSFKRDLGFESEQGYMPGVSTFVKEADGSIYHVAFSYFGPGDDFCSAWFLFDLLPKGVGDWHPKFQY